MVISTLLGEDLGRINGPKKKDGDIAVRIPATTTISITTISTTNSYYNYLRFWSCICVLPIRFLVILMMHLSLDLSNEVYFLSPSYLWDAWYTSNVVPMRVSCLLMHASLPIARRLLTGVKTLGLNSTRLNHPAVLASAPPRPTTTATYRKGA